MTGIKVMLRSFFWTLTFPIWVLLIVAMLLVFDLAFDFLPWGINTPGVWKGIAISMAIVSPIGMCVDYYSYLQTKKVCIHFNTPYLEFMRFGTKKRFTMYKDYEEIESDR
jgi:hypothetical protein